MIENTSPIQQFNTQPIQYLAGIRCGRLDRLQSVGSAAEIESENRGAREAFIFKNMRKNYVF